MAPLSFPKLCENITMELFEYLRSKGVCIGIKVSDELEYVVHPHSTQRQMVVTLTLSSSQTFRTYDVKRKLQNEDVCVANPAEWILRYKVSQDLNPIKVWEDVMHQVGQSLLNENVVALSHRYERHDISLSSISAFQVPMCPVSFDWRS